MQISGEVLEALVSEIFTSLGATQAEANTTAAHLIEANLQGHDSHGVVMVPTYVHNIKRGFLKPNAHISVSKDSGGVLVYDGGAGFGQVVGEEATVAAVDRARDLGVACVGLKNAHHLGRIGTYGELCANAGMVSIHFVNVVGHQPIVAPFGGSEARLQTNPFCVAVPRQEELPIVLDMATSFIAFGKVKVAYNAGKKVRDGVLLDHEGIPSNDPGIMHQEPRGTLQPFGLYKGYGLALMCELLGGALVGNWTMQPENERVGTVINNMFMIVVNPSSLGNLEMFQNEVTAMVDYMHDTRPAMGSEGVLIPGEPERVTRLERLDKGIPLDDQTWSDLINVARTSGVSEVTVSKFS